MNVRAMITIEIEKNGRVYYFSVPLGAPYKEAALAAQEAHQGILELERQAQEQANKEQTVTEAEG